MDTRGHPCGGSASGVWTGSYGGTPVVVAGGGGGVGHGGQSYSSFAGGVPSYAGTALQRIDAVTVGLDNDYGGGGGGYPDGGVGNGGGKWCGGGGGNYAASGGATAAGSNANPGNPGDADRPANADRALRGAGGGVTMARFIIRPTDKQDYTFKRSPFMRGIFKVKPKP